MAAVAEIQAVQGASFDYMAPGTILVGHGLQIADGERYVVIGNDCILHGTDVFVKGDRNTIDGTCARLTGVDNIVYGLAPLTGRGPNTKIRMISDHMIMSGDFTGGAFSGEAPVKYWPQIVFDVAEHQRQASRIEWEAQGARLIDFRRELETMASTCRHQLSAFERTRRARPDAPEGAEWDRHLAELNRRVVAIHHECDRMNDCIIEHEELGAPSTDIMTRAGSIVTATRVITGSWPHIRTPVLDAAPLVAVPVAPPGGVVRRRQALQPNPPVVTTRRAARSRGLFGASPPPPPAQVIELDPGVIQASIDRAFAEADTISTARAIFDRGMIREAGARSRPPSSAALLGLAPPPPKQEDAQFRLFGQPILTVDLPRLAGSTLDDWKRFVKDGTLPLKPNASVMYPEPWPDEPSAPDGLDMSCLCSICADRAPSCVTVPCGHEIMCVTCTVTRKPTICPLCRTPLLMVVRVYGK